MAFTAVPHLTLLAAIMAILDFCDVDPKAAPALVGLASVAAAFFPHPSEDSHWVLQGARRVIDLLAANIGNAENVSKK